MLLTEGVAGWYDSPFIRSLYHCLTPPVTASTNERRSFPIFENVHLVPYICSELFFNDKPDDTLSDVTVVALCNDNWAKVSYVRRLMFLAARFKALDWQRDILFIGYYIVHSFLAMRFTCLCKKFLTNFISLVLQKMERMQI